MAEWWTIEGPEGMCRCDNCHANLEVGARVLTPTHDHEQTFCSHECHEA